MKILLEMQIIMQLEKMKEIFEGKDNDFSVAVALNAAAGLIVSEKQVLLKMVTKI